MGFLRLRLPLVEKRQETPDVWTLRLALGEDAMEYKAGQFIEVGFPGSDLHRAFSISTSPTEPGYVDITVRRLSDGLVSPKLCDAEVGQEFDVKGPFGVFTYATGAFKDLVLVAGGTGIAPFRAFIKLILDQGGTERIRVLYSLRSHDDLIYRDELTRWAGSGRIQLILTATRETDASWPHRRGRFQEEVLDEALKDFDPMCYLCGPKEMLLQMQEWLLKRGLDRKRVKREAWG